MTTQSVHPEIKKEFDRIHQTLASHSGEFLKIHHELAQHRSEFGKVHQELAQNQKEHDQHRGVFAKIHEELSQNRNEHAHFRAEFIKVHRSIDLLAMHVAKNSECIRELQTGQEELKLGQAQIRGSVVVTENRMEEVLAILREFVTPNVQGHGARLDNHEVRISNLEK